MLTYKGEPPQKNGSATNNDASYATSIVRQQVMCSGNAHWGEMYGLCLKGQSNSAAMKQVTSSFCWKCCSRSFAHLSWKSGQSRLGWYGMPGIGSILSRHKYTQSISLTAQMRNGPIGGISTPKCSAKSEGMSSCHCVCVFGHLYGWIFKFIIDCSNVSSNATIPSFVGHGLITWIELLELSYFFTGPPLWYCHRSIVYPPSSI